jgi:predicted nucleotidyltransferase
MIFQPLMSSIDEIASYVYSLGQDHGYELNDVIIYGSRGRGDYDAESDVDIIIVSPDFQGEDYYDRATDIDFSWDIERYPIPDIIPLTLEEFEHRRTAEGDVVREADRDGRHF